MHKIDGFFPFVSGQKVRRLDFRVLEDRIIGRDQIRRSPAVNEWIEAYFAADEDDDDHGRSMALRGVIDSNRADHNAAGLPVYAHLPLPEDFAEELLRSQSQTPLKLLLAKFERSVKPQVAEQLASQASPPSGLAAAARNADDQSLSRQQFVPGFQRQAEDTPPYSARGVGQRLQPFALMGGNEDDGGGAPQAPRGPQKPLPPTPRPHPDSEQRENDRRARHAADCARDYDDFIRIDKAIEQYHNDKVRYEGELNSLEILRGDLIWRRQRTLEDLSTARSRSTSAFWHLECRTHLPIPGRKTKINIGKDIFCEIVKKGVTDKLEEQERWRFEEQKAKDIERLGNQLKNLETRIADTEMQIATKKGQIQAANEALGNLGMGEKRVRDQYNARGCRHGAQDWGA